MKISTLLKTCFTKTTSIKLLVVTFLFSVLFFAGCYEWRRILQPESATINSYFDVFVSAQDDGSPDNDWTNADLIDYGLFGVMIPDGWSVQDSIPFTIECTEAGYTNSGALVYSFSHSQTLEDSIGSPDGYHWWGAVTATEASMVYFDSLSFTPRIFTNDIPGEYFLRYAIGDMDYWDRNPADDVSDPISITIVDNTGVAELFSDENINFYPNPVENTLNINFTKYNSEVIDMKIIDITGKTVKQEMITNKLTTVNLSDFCNGMYFVELNNGNFNQSYKIIVK